MRTAASVRTALAAYAIGVYALSTALLAPATGAQTTPAASKGAPPIAQTTPVRPDTGARNTSVPDSLKKKRADSTQARIGRDDAPRSLEIGESFTYTRDAFYRSGALTLLDLLERVPGLTTFRSGFLPAPQVAGYAGDFGRVRIFFDGIEIDDLETRNGGAPDLKGVPLWTLERMTITRGANEVRVDIRSWEYNKTTPYTRFDLLTGDVNTTIYRIFYGKRFYNGAGLQIAGQQFSVSDQRLGGGGDETSLFGRYGIGRKMWSIDATVVRNHDTRTITRRPFLQSQPAISNYRSSNTLAYIRASIGNQGGGPFLQFVASTQSLREMSSHFDETAAAQYGFPADTADSLASLSQYVATAGYDRGPLRLRVTDRYRTRNGSHYNSPSATADFTTTRFAVSGLVEHDAYQAYNRIEGAARFVPLPFLALSASLGLRNSDSVRNVQPDTRSARAEAAIRLYTRGPWLSGGIITRDTSLLIAPVVFDTSFRSYASGTSTGSIVSLRGPIGKGFSVQASAVHWNDTVAYLPKYQAHAELEFATQWLSKFPSGNFSFRFIPMFDYRTRVRFPGATVDETASSSKIVSLLVEIRILRGEITYQRRNVNLIQYDQVPGFLMPRGVNLYGVRWYFFN